MVAFLAEVLGTQDADLPAMLTGKVALVDGTLVPTFHWRHRGDLLSGKHRRRGVNVQILADLFGRLCAVSSAFPGSWRAWRRRARGRGRSVASCWVPFDAGSTGGGRVMTAWGCSRGRPNHRSAQVQSFQLRSTFLIRDTQPRSSTVKAPG
jgi:hypothetical protein